MKLYFRRSTYIMQLVEVTSKRDRKDFLGAEAVEFRDVGRLLLRIDFVDDEKDGFGRTP